MTFKKFIISRVQIFFCLVPLILMASVIIGNIYAPEQVFHYADLLAPIITAGFCFRKPQATCTEIWVSG